MLDNLETITSIVNSFIKDIEKNKKDKLKCIKTIQSELYDNFIKLENMRTELVKYEPIDRDYLIAEYELKKFNNK